jgi:hypothetical protein
LRASIVKNKFKYFRNCTVLKIVRRLSQGLYLSYSYTRRKKKKKERKRKRKGKKKKNEPGIYSNKIFLPVSFLSF